MNPEMPHTPRQEIEASLTALLLGELPHEQAAALHQKLAQDAELAALYERLKHTINLVRETVSSPAEQKAAQPAPLKLSDQRRQKLLQQFKTVAPREFAQPRRRRGPTLIEVGIAAGLVAILGALLLPALGKAKSKGHSLAMRSFSLSKDAESAAPALPVAPNFRNYLDLNRNGRTEQFASESASRGVITLPPPPATLASPPPNPVGAAIVLPRAGELADVTTTPSASPSGQAGDTLSATTRGFYDDSLGRGGGGVGGGFGGGAARGSTGTSVGGTQRQYPNDSAIGDAYFSADPETHRLAYIADEASRPPAEVRRGAELLREPAAPLAQPANPPSGQPYPTASYYGGAAYSGYSNAKVPGAERVHIDGVGDVPVLRQRALSDGKDAGISQGKVEPASPQETAVNEAAYRQAERLTPGLRPPEAPLSAPGGNGPTVAGDAVNSAQWNLGIGNANTPPAFGSGNEKNKDGKLAFNADLERQTNVAGGESSRRETVPSYNLQDANPADVNAALQDLFQRNAVAHGAHSADEVDRSKASPLALPPAQGEISLGLKDSNGADQKGRQMAAAASDAPPTVQNSTPAGIPAR